VGSAIEQDLAKIRGQKPRSIDDDLAAIRASKPPPRDETPAPDNSFDPIGTLRKAGNYIADEAGVRDYIVEPAKQIIADPLHAPLAIAKSITGQMAQRANEMAVGGGAAKPASAGKSRYGFGGGMPGVEKTPTPLETAKAALATVGNLAGGGLGEVGDVVAAKVAPRIGEVVAKILGHGATGATYMETQDPTHPIKSLVGGGLMGAGMGAVPEVVKAVRPIHEDLAAIRVKQLETELAAQTNRRATAERAADVDELTNIANKRAFTKALPTAEKDANTAIVRFDINGFKSVNDVHGHAAGDKALAQIPTSLAQAAADLKIPERLFRVGGDEFAAIVPKDVAEAYRDRAEELYGIRDHGNDVRTSISGGVGLTDAAADAAAITRKQTQSAAQGIRGRGGKVPAEPLPSEAPAVPKRSERGLYNSRTTPAGKLYKPEEMETQPLLDEVLRRRQAAETYYDFKNARKYGPGSVVTRNNDTALAKAEGMLMERDGLSREQIDNEVNTRMEATGDTSFNYGANEGTAELPYMRATVRAKTGESDLFGKPVEADVPAQTSMLDENAGTAGTRPLAGAERAARGELEKVRVQLQGETDPAKRMAAASRVAELERLVNRDQSIGAPEMAARAASEPPVEPPPADQQSFFMRAQPTPGAIAHTQPMEVPVGSASPQPAVQDATIHPTPNAPGLGSSRPVQWAAIPRAIKALVNPMALGPTAEATGGLIRHVTAMGWREQAIRNEALRSLGDYVGKFTKLQSVQVWDAAEHGKPTGDPTVDAALPTLRTAQDHLTKQLIDLDRFKAAAAIDNYLGRFWEQPGQTDMGMIGRLFGKRPLEGPKSFLKQRTLVNFTDGLDRGLVPLTYNFVDAQLAKMTEMQRVINAEQMLREEKAAGRAKPVVFGQKPPVDSEGRPWQRIDTTGSDPAFTVYGPPNVTVKEAFDANVRAQLTDVIEGLPNLEHERLPRVNMGGRSAAGAWGVASTAGEKMQTRYGGPDTVIMHELGHVLDARYRLYRKLVLPNDQSPVLGELRSLAELRHEGLPNVTPKFKNYVQGREEQIANAVHALIYAPELMQQVAPTVRTRLISFLQSKPELAPLLDIKPSLAIGEAEYKTPIFGITTVGHWHAPAESAAVWHNYLSRGLKGNPLVDAYMAPAQAAQQMMLGISGFHGTVIATEAMFSELALGVENLVNRGGVRGRVPASVPRAAVAPVTGAAIGRRVMQEFLKPGTHPELANVIDGMMKGGYRGTIQSEFWTGDRIQNLKKAYGDALNAESKGRRFFGMAKLPLDALWAGIELASKPILGKYVPWQKTYATYAKVAQELARLPEGTPIEDVRRVMGDVVNEMDYRFGQVIYDNHFINNTVKNIAQMMFLAPGWTAGTATLMGRGASQAIRGLDEAGRVAWSKVGVGENRPRRVGDTEFAGPSAAYWLSAAAGTMLINGIMTKIYTGQDPHGKDFWAFRNGTTDANGNPNRSTIPGYIMHDVRGWMTHPVKLFGNKLSPLLTYMWHAAKNQDYFGDEVYNPEDLAMTRAVQLGKAAGKQFGPLSIQNYLEAKKRGQTGTQQKVMNAFGITPAPRDFVRTDAENKMNEYGVLRGHRIATPEQKAASDARSSIVAGLRSGDRVSAFKIAKDALASKAMTRKEVDLAMKAAAKNTSIESFKRLSVPQALEVYKLGSQEEKARWQQALSNKLSRARKAGKF